MIPPGLSPMLATAGPLPTGEGWAYEPKWDGYRALVTVSNGTASARSRRDQDLTSLCPSLQDLTTIAVDVVLDGELVALVDGVPSFDALQERSVPVTFIPFDVLHAAEQPLLKVPYDDRRAFLLELVPTAPAAHLGDGQAFLDATLTQGLEGVVAKRRDSLYWPGRRTESWVKVKHTYHQAAVVGGWTEGQRGAPGTVGSLLLGVPASSGLVFVGHVGSGLSGRSAAELERLLAPLRRATSPFTTTPEDAHWVEPVVVVEVEFATWTRDGRLRHPTFRGVRADLTPGDVVLEAGPNRPGLS